MDRLLYSSDQMETSDVYADIINGVGDKAGKDLVPREWGDPVPLLDEMVKNGHIGKKAGRGFYDVFFSLTLQWLLCLTDMGLLQDYDQ